MLHDIYMGSLECMQSHFCVESKESKQRMFGKTAIIIHHKMLSIVAYCDLILSQSQKVSSSSSKKGGKGTGLSCPLIGVPPIVGHIRVGME